MPQFPGFPERPYYNSVNAYLSEMSKDIAEIVVDPIKMGRFMEQLKKYTEFWQQWETFKDADQKGCWKPEMGRPECIFNIFSRSYNLFNESEKEEKRLAGSYALCALIHDSQLPHLDKINTGIIPIEAIEETLSAPRNTLEGRGIWNGGPDVREIYLIEEFFNRVIVDLQEFCKSEENKLKQTTIEEQIQQLNKLPNAEFFKLIAKKFEDRAKKVLSKNETWHDLDRFLKGWLDAAIERLKQLNVTENEIGLFNYIYKNLLHYAKGINIKNFRGFPDSRIVELATKTAFELAEKFKELSERDKENQPPKKPEESESSDIFDLLKKDYLLKSEDNLKQKIAEVAQDFMSRGLFNSTACVSKQLSTYFEHINELINYIEKSIEQDFSNIPLDNVKEKLFTIVDEEYKKLVPIANIQLVNAGLAQQNILKSFEQQIDNKKKKAMQAIETRLSILVKKNEIPKNETGHESKERDTRKGGDTYIANQMSFGDKAQHQHANRDIKTITSEPEKEKSRWKLFVALLAFLLLLTSLILNFKEIKEWFFLKENESVSTIKEDTTIQSNERSLYISLKNIIEDIESRPLAQQRDTAKQYVGLLIKRELLRVHKIEINLGDSSVFNLGLTFPVEANSPISKWTILCEVSREQYPQLNIAREGMELYVSGEIEETFWRFGDSEDANVMLSSVKLEFE